MRLTIRAHDRPLLYALLIACVLGGPLPVRAGGMDPVLSRLRLAPGEGDCPDRGAYCADNEAFEHLVADLAVVTAPALGSGAGALGARGFSLSWSLALAPISGRHWRVASAGDDPLGASGHPSPDDLLAWNRLEVRKGLPFGLEVGAAIGHGLDTSLWLVGLELRAGLFEGFRSGLGALPDVAVRGVLQTLLGAAELSLQTLALDVTLSKPYVVAGRHRLTPLIGLQALFVNVETRPVDLTPGVSAWDACAPGPGQFDAAGAAVLPAVPDCTGDAAELENDARFASLHQTRIRLFVGLEERYGPFMSALSAGFDLAAPRRRAGSAEGELPHALTLHFALGLRY